MAKLHTAERVSRCDASDNFVFQRSLLAYYQAAESVEGDVLEIGTGVGYGAEVIAPQAKRFVTIDKTAPEGLALPDNAMFWQMKVPPIAMPEEAFDCVVSFQAEETQNSFFSMTLFLCGEWFCHCQYCLHSCSTGLFP